MKTSKSIPIDIDDYIAGFPQETQKILQKLRQAIKQAAPEAQEAISYQMPTVKLNGSLVYFGAFKNHIGFYPTASGIREFKNELASYESSKGAVQFPFGKHLPLDLISKIVEFRVKENNQKAAAKLKLANAKTGKA